MIICGTWLHYLSALTNRAPFDPCSDSSNSSSGNGLSMDSINMLYHQQQQPQQQGCTNLESSMGSGLGLSLANASTRSNSPESQNSGQSMNEPNLLDMIVSLSNVPTLKKVFATKKLLNWRRITSVSFR